MEDIILSDADNELREEILERFESVKDYFADWEKEAAEDYKFALGDQWTDEERAALAEQARPCLTFNRIRPLINIVSGYQRENSARIKVNPEGGEDKVFSEVCDKAMRAIDKWSHLAYKMGYWFDDGLYCGKGFLEAMLNFENDPITGELNFKIRSPYEIKIDRNSKEYDFNEDAEFLFKISLLTRRQLKALYPNKAELIEGFTTDTDEMVDNAGGFIRTDGENYGNNEKTISSVTGSSRTTPTEHKPDQPFTHKEYWYKKYVTRYFVVDPETKLPKKFNKKEQAEVYAGTVGRKVIERKVAEMWVAAMVCGWILQDTISPFEPFYSGFPFFRFLADWAPNAQDETLRVQGIVRSLKDPQREKNKAKSQNLHILNTQANSGWVGDDDAMKDGADWDKLESMGSKPGVVIRKRKGSELREILPKGPNAGMIQREEKADEEFKQISVINPDLMGFQEGTASGRAIGLRIRQAILGLVRLFTNYRYSKEIIGKFILEMVPMLFDVQKLMKVLGPDYMRKAIDPERYQQGLDEGHIAAFLRMIADNKYDVLVTEADQNATLRAETFTQLVELAKTPVGQFIPFDLIIDYMEVPNAEEVKQKIQQQKQEMMAAAQAAKGQPGA